MTSRGALSVAEAVVVRVETWGLLSRGVSARAAVVSVVVDLWWWGRDHPESFVECLSLDESAELLSRVVRLLIARFVRASGLPVVEVSRLHSVVWSLGVREAMAEACGGGSVVDVSVSVERVLDAAVTRHGVVGVWA